jgi:exo-beta-1,3-glucanase (GH17 family)
MSMSLTPENQLTRPTSAVSIATRATTEPTTTTSSSAPLLSDNEAEEQSSPSARTASSSQSTDIDSTSQWQQRYGISYAPYRENGTCKTQAEVDADFDRISPVYNLVRIYGVDCNQVALVKDSIERRRRQQPQQNQLPPHVETPPSRSNRGDMRMFAGVFDLSDLQGSLNTIIAAAAGDWSAFDTISIGNELVNKGQNSPADVVNAVNIARTTLRAAGYRGPVVTVDTFNQMIKYPELCQASDYCAVNCHAFFDATQTAADAGKYVREQADKVASAANGNYNNNKRTVITESGWPYAGQANGAAIPSRENQRTAILSLMHEFAQGDLILFSAFDDRWKTDNAGTFGTEKYWGFMGTY